MKSEYPHLLFAGPDGEILDHPHLRMAGRSGDRVTLPDPSELVPLPPGSQLFTLPGRVPFGWDEGINSFVPVEKVRIGRKALSCTAVAAFLPPGYVRTLLPATKASSKKTTLPLWAYTAVGWKEGKFWATGLLIDANPHWNPRYFQNVRGLDRKIAAMLRGSPTNRLVRQLARCALEYRCFAAKNVFFRRWECPLPVSRSCNAGCLGCISLQPSECCPASQERIEFTPTLAEVLEVGVPHLREADDAIVSFGQGCEGEPLTQWRLLEGAIRGFREKTGRGTINLNTNGSFPERVKRLCGAGLDSIRVTLSSARSKFYIAYHRPKGYAFRRVVDSLLEAKANGVYASINLLVFPGFTDRQEEIEHLLRLIDETSLDLMQMRNLNIDPDLYLEAMGKGSGIGIPKMIETLRAEFPLLQFGYFNRTQESFYGTPS
jgi:pyruvate-formate lyase-activating enzyme